MKVHKMSHIKISEHFEILPLSLIKMNEFLKQFNLKIRLDLPKGKIF